MLIVVSAGAKTATFQSYEQSSFDGSQYIFAHGIPQSTELTACFWLLAYPGYDDEFIISYAVAGRCFYLYVRSLSAPSSPL